MLDLAKLFGSNPPGTVTVTYRKDAEVPAAFALVLNISRLAGKKSVEIAPGLKLRRATIEEITFVKETLKSLFGSHFVGALWETKRPESGRGSYVTLPVKQWRYFVIESAGDITDLELLEQTLSIARCDLEIGLVVLKAALNKMALPVCAYRPAQLFQALSELSREHHSEAGPGKIVSKLTETTLVKSMQSYSRMTTAF
jgi:hypothetical protein